MSTTLNEKTEKAKNNFRTSAERSKETVKEIIETNKRYLDKYLNFGSKGKGNGKTEPHSSINDTMKYTVEKSVELSETAFNSLIDAYIKQIEFTVDYNSRLIDALKESQKGHPDTLLKLVDESLVTSFDLANNNIREIFNLYNKQFKLSVDLNKKIGEIYTNQLESVFTLQNNNLNRFTGWASEWWKHEDARN